jgi:hypothetical protein
MCLGRLCQPKIDFDPTSCTSFSKKKKKPHVPASLPWKTYPVVHAYHMTAGAENRQLMQYRHRKFKIGRREL